MVRTADPVGNSLRREAIIDVAEGLIRTRGYEQMSIQDVQDELGISRGAIYHYFDSKSALLAAVVERMVQVAATTVSPIVTDPELTALEKLQRVFAGIYQWKSEQPEFQPDAVAGLMRTWYSDENAVVLERMRAAVAARLTPLLTDILCQGAADGSFSLTYPAGTASALTSLLLGINEAAVRLFLGRRDGTVSFDTASCTLAAYFEAFERMLGLPPTPWPLLDEGTLRLWFG
jgi:AcrR family transcriptional regulator